MGVHRDGIGGATVTGGNPVVDLKIPEHIVGQEQALQFLAAAVRKQRVTTAYCFVGSDGIGRALSARWFAQAVLCEQYGDPNGLVPCGQCLNCRLSSQGSHPDLLWIEPTYTHQGKRISRSEAAEQNLQRRAKPQVRLDQIQEVVTFVGRSPLRASRSVVVIEGAETLAESAGNALLKTLEEPGSALLILIVTSLSQLLPTLVSRCQGIPFRRLATAQVRQVIAPHQDPDLALEQIPSAVWDLAQGSPGLALEALQQWQQIPPDVLQALEQWPSGIADAFKVGRQVAKALDVPAQLWLVDYLQLWHWHHPNPQQLARIRQLDRIRQQLMVYAQPQLVWEVNLAQVVA
ncbi:MAG: DNA polymerase III subunit delta' [Cyanophyceae cyanobacterium]